MNNSSNLLLDAIATNPSYFTVVDYSVFGFLLSCSLAIGIYFGWCTNETQTTEEYLVGGHKMKSIPIAISLVASQLSAVAIMTIPVEIYSFGWQYSLLIPTLILITLASNYLFIPVFYHNNIDNCYDYLELRFSKTVKKIVTASYVFIGIFFMPVILYIPSLALAGVTGHNIHVVNSIVCYVCVFYTMLGGIKAVVWTDVVQSCVMFLSVILVTWYGIQKAGGLTEIWNLGVAGGRISAPDFSLDLTTRQSFWNMIIGTYIMWTCDISFNQTCVQRIISLPSLAHSRKSLLLFCIGVMLVMTCYCFTGIIMYAFYYDCDPVKAKILNKYDEMTPRFIREVVGDLTGMAGIFISSVFSASLGTVSATLNSLAGILYTDYIRPLKIFRHNDTNANRTMKIIVFAIGTLAAMGGIIVEQFHSIFQVINTVAGTCVGAVFGVFTLGMLYPWANKTGALYGTIISMGTLLCIITNSQFAITRGLLKYDIMPTSIEGCKNDTLPLLGYLNSTKIVSPFNDTNEFAFYKIAFMWYAPLGALITWTSAIIISYFTGGQDLSKLNPNLLAPCIKYMLPKKYQHIQLQDLTKLDDSKEANKVNEAELCWTNDKQSHTE